MRSICKIAILLLSATMASAGSPVGLVGAEKPPENGMPLFTLLSPTQSGVKFSNDLKDTREHNIMIYSNFYGGAGVAIGDFNNDGLQDLFFAGNQVEDKLYFNQGNMTFQDVTRKAGIKDNGGWSSGVILGDINQDGWLDIYVTRELYDDEPELRRNKLYINQGDGTFSEEAEAYGVDDSERTRHATFLDYDRDGDLDLFLCNQPPNPGDYSKFYETELMRPEWSIKLYAFDDGKFTEVTEAAGLKKTGFPNSVTASDINNDGWTDLYIANDFWIEDWIFMNNGDGTFSNELYERANHISFSSMGVDAGDIDNDGDLDVMVVDMAAEDNYRLKTNMSGMNPRAFWKVVNDGGHYQYMFNMLHLNQGDGYFSDVAQLADMANTDWSWSPLMADFDNDGWKDVFVTNGLMRDIRNNDASKTFPKYLESQLFAYLQKNPNPAGQVSVWDVVDIDKAMKLVPSQKLSNYMYRNNGDLTFTKQMEAWGLDQETFSHGAAYGDLDNDGDLDLVINNVNDVAFIYENHASDREQSHYLRVQLVPDRPDIQQLGTRVQIQHDTTQQMFEVTLVRGMYSTSELTPHFGLGARTTVDLVQVTWPDGKRQAFTDVAADQTLQVRYSEAVAPIKAEQAVASTWLEEVSPAPLAYVHKENSYDDYEKQVLIPHKMSTMGPHISIGDVNGDGLDDCFVGGAFGQTGAVFIQQPEGELMAVPNPDFELDRAREDMGSAFFDADQDGDLDLYVVSGGNEHKEGSSAYQDRLYLNDGNGKFTRANDALPDLAFCGSQVRPADIDADGDLDLFVAGRHKAWSYPEPASSALLLNEGGTFRDATRDLAPEFLELGMVNDAQWVDIDQDDDLDLLVAGEWMAPTLFVNQGGNLICDTENATLNSLKGWWFCIEVADMDGDGDPDILAGNLGRNYKYKASEEEPFEVYYYDFDENGSKDVVLTYYNFGIKYPLRGRECSSQQVPMIKEKFENYDLFASSDVFEVYGENKLEEALHLEATDFSSVFIENLGDGNFRSHALPVLAQISSVNDFVVDDFNADGHLDVLLAGNLFDAEVETARADGSYGLVLAGNGKGGFTPVEKAKSGVFLPYNVKSMAKLGTQTDRLVLVACNDGALKVYRY